MSVSEKTSVIERLTKPAHLIDMKDIIREGNPTLRAIAEEVSFPLSDQEIILGEKMMQFLKHSQDPVMAEKMGLRGGVGLAAPQLDISKRLIAVLVPNPDDEEGNPPKGAYSLQTLTLTKTVKSIVSSSRAIMPSLFSMKSTISTASCSTTASTKKTHSQSRTACW